MLDPDSTLCELGGRGGDGDLPALSDLAFTLQVGRRSLEARLALVVEDLNGLRAELRRFISDGHPGERGWLGTVSGTNSAGSECVALFRAGRLREVAERWAAGAAVDWRACVAGAARCRVRLPVTPLPEERCWIGAWKSKIGAVAVPSAPSAGARYPVKLQILEGGIAVLSMREDGNRNMLTDELLRALEQSFAEITSRPELTVVVLTGSEQVFCMGGAPEALEALAAKQKTFTDAAFVYEGLLRCELPVIAAIRGHAAGGGLAFGLYADAVVMSRDGSYTANFLKYCFTPGMGASYILEHRFGAALAAEMMFTGRTYRGDELERRGAQVLFEASDQVLPRALSLATSMSEMPTEALRVLKQELSGRTLAALSDVIPREVAMHERVLGDGAVERVRIRFPTATEAPRLPRVEPSVVSISGMPPEPVGADRDQIVRRIETSLCSILYLERHEIRHDQSFRDMGVDFIGAVEIVRDLNQAFGTDLD